MPVRGYAHGLQLLELAPEPCIQTQRQHGQKHQQDTEHARWIARFVRTAVALVQKRQEPDRKSTRLNSSHSQISYAVFCLKKKTEPLLTAALHEVVINK